MKTYNTVSGSEYQVREDTGHARQTVCGGQRRKPSGHLVLGKWTKFITHEIVNGRLVLGWPDGNFTVTSLLVGQ